MVERRVVCVEIPMTKLVTDREALEARVFGELRLAVLVQDDQPVLRLQAGEDHLARELINGLPEKVESEDLLGEELERDGWRECSPELSGKLVKPCLRTRFNVIVS